MTSLRKVLKWLFGIAFVLAGANHFISVNFYLRMMPPILPLPLLLIYLSGFFEIVLGILLITPKYSRRAAWGLVALLIAVFPANIYMALNTELFPEFSPAAQHLRLPLQFLLIALAYWFTKKIDNG